MLSDFIVIVLRVSELTTVRVNNILFHKPDFQVVQNWNKKGIQINLKNENW